MTVCGDHAREIVLIPFTQRPIDRAAGGRFSARPVLLQMQQDLSSTVPLRTRAVRPSELRNSPDPLRSRHDPTRADANEDNIVAGRSGVRPSVAVDLYEIVSRCHCGPWLLTSLPLGWRFADPRLCCGSPSGKDAPRGPRGHYGSRDGGWGRPVESTLGMG